MNLQQPSMHPTCTYPTGRICQDDLQKLLTNKHVSTVVLKKNIYIVNIKDTQTISSTAYDLKNIYIVNTKEKYIYIL